jgi:5'-nucleotidase
MRWPNDQRLLDNVEGIDLCLGGHDHFYKVETYSNSTIVKSGSDFRDFSVLTVRFVPAAVAPECGSPNGLDPDACLSWQLTDGGAEAGLAVSVARVSVGIEEPEDEALASFLSALEHRLEANLGKVVGYTEVPWDVRGEAIRTRESPFGSFVAGVIRCRYGADFALL